MTTAAFSITGSTSGASPSTDAGFDAVEGETLTFALEASPGVDVRSTLFEVVSVVPAATASLALSGSGVPSTPLGGVTATVVDDFAAYLVRCTINGGVNADGSANPDWVRERIVVVRRGGVRPVVPGERTQYDITAGWFEALNQLLSRASADALGELAGGGTLQTANATLTTVATVTPTITDGILVLEASALARDIVSGDIAYYRIEWTYLVTAGTPSLEATRNVQIYESDASWTVAQAVSGSDVLVRVQGDAYNAVDWRVGYRAAELGA